MHNRSPQPDTCAPRSGPVGVHDARSSICAPSPWACKLAEARREHLRRRAGCCGVGGAALRERIDEPRPRDIREEGVDADLGLEGRLCEADDAEWPAPGVRSARVVQQHEPAGAEFGVVAVAGGCDIRGEWRSSTARGCLARRSRSARAPAGSRQLAPTRARRRMQEGPRVQLRMRSQVEVWSSLVVSPLRHAATRRRGDRGR